MSRYETLEVSLQTDNRNSSHLSQTVDYEDKDTGDADERVLRFRELYYRNEKLRKELKILNARLNERLEKVKFPTVKKRAASVDLNHNPPNKALQRELQNAYKQVKMYKQQIQFLKIKEESAENYAKLKDMENMISFRDKQIAAVQEQLKSIKNIKKMQEKKIVAELENEEVKERLQEYESEHKQLRDKMKDMARKTRRRDEEYKKQQAYLVSLEKKAREFNEGIQEVQKPRQHHELVTNRLISEQEFQEVKAELANQKKINDDILKKIQAHKRQAKIDRDQHIKETALLKEKEALWKNLQMKIMSLNRLIREDEKRDKEPPKNKLILKSEDIQEDNLEDSFSDPPQSISKEDMSLNQMLRDIQAGQREWKGKLRKVEHGFGNPSDRKFQYEGILIGFKICLDENEAICGIQPIFLEKGIRKEGELQGSRSSIELEWSVGEGDSISKISGSFTEQSYLSELVLISRMGKSGLFGSSSVDLFGFRISDDERISGFFGSIRELGADRRVSQIGFWIERASQK